MNNNNDEISKINRLCDLLPQDAKIEATALGHIYPYWYGNIIKIFIYSIRKCFCY